MGDLKVENTSFPTSLDTATLHANGDTITAQAANGPNTAIIAIETELGTGIKGTMTNLAARLGVNLHTDGGLLLGTAFPGSPPVKPHFFWRTDETKLYIYNTATASYNELLSTVGLANYVAKTVDTTITATHTFNPSVAGPPFILGANAQNQKVTGLDADKLDGLTTATASTASTIVARDADGDITAKQLISDIAIGTAPLVVTSTTEVANLKAATATLATTATSLAMTGEASAKTTTSTTNLDFGSVQNGDRILVNIYAETSGAGTTAGYTSVSWSGSATAKICNDLGSPTTLNAAPIAVAATWISTFAFIIQITGNGTFTFTNIITNVGGTPIYNNQIYAFFLKKQ